VCQAFLGTKVPTPRSADLVAVMRRTVGALFSSLESNFPAWSAVKGSEAVPTLGNPHPAVPESARVNRKRLHEMFADGVAQLQPVLQTILSDATLSELQKIAAMEIDQFHYPADTWAKTVYEFTASYHKSTINRDHILQALVPLYRGRSLTFLLENRNGSRETIEQHEESLCGEFERLKPYLLEIWAGGK